jgi:alkanesulfonate monooxygenase SsuD/methylene tetrahydromethanopterin reductase-like flavin-dependent oxidoreductase (luciferase family)
VDDTPGVRLRVGILLLPNEPWRVASGRWRAVEELGFDHAWTYDHVVWRRLGDGAWFDGLATLAAAATVTSTIELGTLVTSPNLRHPAVLAKTAATIGDLSGGRLVLGVGAGSAGGDAQLLGEHELTPGERVARFEEFVALLPPLLAGEAVDHQGTSYRVHDAGLQPAYLPDGSAPLLVASNGPRGMRLAATYGRGWVTDGGYYGLDEPTPARFRDNAVTLLRRFAAAAASVGRDATTMRRLVVAAPGAEPLTDPSTFLHACRHYAAAGFTDVVVHDPGPLGGDGTAVRRVATEVLGAVQELPVAAPR